MEFVPINENEINFSDSDSFDLFAPENIANKTEEVCRLFEFETTPLEDKVSEVNLEFPDIPEIIRNNQNSFSEFIKIRSLILLSYRNLTPTLCENTRCHPKRKPKRKVTTYSSEKITTYSSEKITTYSSEEEKEERQISKYTGEERKLIQGRIRELKRCFKDNWRFHSVLRKLKEENDRILENKDGKDYIENLCNEDGDYNMISREDLICDLELSRQIYYEECIIYLERYSTVSRFLRDFILGKVTYLYSAIKSKDTISLSEIKEKLMKHIPLDDSINSERSFNVLESKIHLLLDKMRVVFKTDYNIDMTVDKTNLLIDISEFLEM